MVAMSQPLLLEPHLLRRHRRPGFHRRQKKMADRAGDRAELLSLGDPLCDPRL